MNFDIDGLTYYVDVWETAHNQRETVSIGNKPLVLLHGFTGNASSWRKLKPHFEGITNVFAIDIVGHGKTDAPEDVSRYTIESAARDIDLIFEQMGIEQTNILGYSMGGRLALTFALKYPNRVEKLILESASPGLEEEEQRAARRIQDEKLAIRILEEGIPSFIDYWENIPLFGTQKRLAENIQEEIRNQRLTNSQIGIVNSLKGMGTGSQPSWWNQLDELSMPVLLLTGNLDEKFCQIADRMQGIMKNARRITISECGHAIHVEKPKIFGTIVSEFLSNEKGQALSPFLMREDIHTKEDSVMSAVEWIAGKQYEEIIYETYNGIAKITINRPEKHNAFTPRTVMELIDAFAYARDDANVGVIILTGAGDRAFCSGGDQSVRGHGGYVGDDQIPRLNVLDLQRLIRVIPKPVVAMVKGYAIGGGHVLHIVCDLTIAADNAVFGQTGPKVGSFDAGYGSGYLARIVGHKKAREIWYLCRQYNAQEALDMGLVNTVVPLDQVEEETIKWCEEMLEKSPTALRFLKAAFNADTDGLAGIQQFAGDATLLYYTTDEAKEGRDAFKEKRKPDFGQFPRFP